VSVPAEARDADGAQPLHLEFDDNRLMGALCGAHDEHLARIEKKLGVIIVPKGNRLMVSGALDARDHARAAITMLYGWLKKGREVGRQDVDAAVRMTAKQAGNTGKASEDAAAGDLAIATKKRLVTPRSPGQAEYMRALQQYEMTFGLGPAGTGKTYIAVAMAVSLLQSGAVDRLVLSRPAVEAGERLGFLPGDMREKVDPYLRPLYDALHDLMPADQVLRRLETGEIEVAPLAFMRGRTLSNAFIIVDEAQNTTPMQMKMLLTRMGENSRMAVTGDLSQIDLPGGVKSGLRDAVALLEGIEGIGFAYFSHADVVRHDLVSRIVQAYDSREGLQEELALETSPEESEDGKE
jgi:phosphate starvation-inducible PhoH-like protein